MKSFAKYIESEIEKEPENKLLEASSMYEKKFGTIPEMEKIYAKAYLELNRN